VQQALARVESLVVNAKAIGAQTLGRGEKIRKLFEPGLAAFLGGAARHYAALDAHAAQQGRNDQSRARNLKRIPITRGHPAGMPDHMRGRSGKRLRKAHNGLRIDLTLLSRPFRRVGGNKFGQFGKTRGVSVHIILVIELAGNKRVDDAQIEGIVRTGADKQKIIGLGGRNIVADINDRELAAFAQGLHDGSGLAKVDGFKNVARLQYNVLAVGKVVHGHAAAEAHDSLAGVVGVEVARGAVRTDVGRTDAAHKGAIQVGKGAVSVRPQHGFPAVLLLH